MVLVHCIVRYAAQQQHALEIHPPMDRLLYHRDNADICQR